MPTDSTPSPHATRETNIHGSKQTAQERLVLDRKFYVGEEMWWNAVQEDGQLIESSTKTTRTLSRDGHSYPKIYDLVREMYNIYKKDLEVFELLLSNKTDTCRRIGLELLKRRLSIIRADMHSIADATLLPFMQSAPREQTQFFILNQKDMLTWAMSKWSKLSQEKMQKTTDNDRLRVFGILFSEQLREYLPLVTGICNHNKNRGELDEKNSLLRSVIKTAHSKFHDKEVVVEHPTSWLSQETKEKIELDIHPELNPNDKQRIDVSRTSANIQSIIKTTTQQYNKVMKNYTKGTGGGPGHPANFANWQERDPLYFGDYDSNSKSCYLTYIHMLNQQYDHPRRSMISFQMKQGSKTSLAQEAHRR